MPIAFRGGQLPYFHDRVSGSDAMWQSIGHRHCKRRTDLFDHRRCGRRARGAYVIRTDGLGCTLGARDAFDAYSPRAKSYTLRFSASQCTAGLLSVTMPANYGDIGAEGLSRAACARSGCGSTFLLDHRSRPGFEPAKILTFWRFPDERKARRFYTQTLAETQWADDAERMASRASPCSVSAEFAGRAWPTRKTYQFAGCSRSTTLHAAGLKVVLRPRRQQPTPKAGGRDARMLASQRTDGSEMSNTARRRLMFYMTASRGCKRITASLAKAIGEIGVCAGRPTMRILIAHHAVFPTDSPRRVLSAWQKNINKQKKKNTSHREDA